MTTNATANEKKQLKDFSNESLAAREVVDEILRYGVSQTQIKIIIKLLALELEDIQLMKKIATSINESDESSPDVTQKKSKILL